MTVTVRIPASLQRFSGGASRVSLEADDLAGSLAGLARLHPELGSNIMAADGRVRPFVRVFVNERDCSRADGAALQLAAGDTITLMPAFAGG
jgi:molybdopterin converting factor small subunit